MNKGKAKCNKLKAIRKALAKKLGIDLHQQECTFEGECKGTCPKCKQEEQVLNREIFKRAAGLGVGALATMSLAGCGPIDNLKGGNQIPPDAAGGMTYIEPSSDETLSGDVEYMGENEEETDESPLDKIDGDIYFDESEESEEESEEDESPLDIDEDTYFDESEEEYVPEIAPGVLEYIPEDSDE